MGKLKKEKTSVRRMRTIRQALELIKQEDPDTGLNYNIINNLCKNNLVHTVMMGRKYLVDLDDLINYFN